MVYLNIQTRPKMQLTWFLFLRFNIRSLFWNKTILKLVSSELFPLGREAAMFAFVCQAAYLIKNLGSWWATLIMHFTHMIHYRTRHNTAKLNVSLARHNTELNTGAYNLHLSLTKIARYIKKQKADNILVLLFFPLDEILSDLYNTE